MKPKALMVQHFSADAPWYLEAALAKAGVRTDLRRVGDGDRLPHSLEGYDALVVLGGPDSASQQSDGYPTLDAELELFVEAHELSKPALGICLGAQALARAAGADVYAGTAGKEIGWGKVVLADDALSRGIFYGCEREIMSLHWHGDTFDLPDEARLLASSEKYPTQAFEWGSCVGLQFHLEVNSMGAVEAFIEAFPDEAALAEGGASEILRTTEAAIGAAEPARIAVFDGWARSIAAERSMRLGRS